MVKIHNDKYKNNSGLPLYAIGSKVYILEFDKYDSSINHTDMTVSGVQSYRSGDDTYFKYELAYNDGETLEEMFDEWYLYDNKDELLHTLKEIYEEAVRNITKDAENK